MMIDHEKTIVEVQVINGFIQNGSGGNPAGVVLDADSLNETEMQQIAHHAGLSETAFVSQSTSEGFKLDFFTPNRRIAHCGHATIAAFSHLAHLGRVTDGETSKETVDGPRKVIIQNGAAFMEQLAPKYETAQTWSASSISNETILQSIGITKDDLAPKAEPILVNTGNSFIVIGVKDGTVLANLKPDFEKISQISEDLDLVGYYIFTTSSDATNKDATTRMFAPRYAIEEESATGMAAGPLACMLRDKLGLEKSCFEIEQGHFMTPASPSIITVELNLEDGKITGLMAGGFGKPMRSIKVELD